MNINYCTRMLIYNLFLILVLIVTTQADVTENEDPEKWATVQKSTKSKGVSVKAEVSGYRHVTDTNHELKSNGIPEIKSNDDARLDSQSDISPNRRTDSTSKNLGLIDHLVGMISNEVGSKSEHNKDQKTRSGISLPEMTNPKVDAKNTKYESKKSYKKSSEMSTRKEASESNYHYSVAKAAPSSLTNNNSDVRLRSADNIRQVTPYSGMFSPSTAEFQPTYRYEAPSSFYSTKNIPKYSYAPVWDYADKRNEVIDEFKPRYDYSDPESYRSALYSGDTGYMNRAEKAASAPSAVTNWNSHDMSHALDEYRNVNDQTSYAAAQSAARFVPMNYQALSPSAFEQPYLASQGQSTQATAASQSGYIHPDFRQSVQAPQAQGYRFLMPDFNSAQSESQASATQQSPIPIPDFRQSSQATAAAYSTYAHPELRQPYVGSETTGFGSMMPNLNSRQSPLSISGADYNQAQAYSAAQASAYHSMSPDFNSKLSSSAAATAHSASFDSSLNQPSSASQASAYHSQLPDFNSRVSSSAAATAHSTSLDSGLRQPSSASQASAYHSMLPDFNSRVSSSAAATAHSAASNTGIRQPSSELQVPPYHSMFPDLNSRLSSSAAATAHSASLNSDLRQPSSASRALAYSSMTPDLNSRISSSAAATAHSASLNHDLRQPSSASQALAYSSMTPDLNSRISSSAAAAAHSASLNPDLRQPSSASQALAYSSMSPDLNSRLSSSAAASAHATPLNPDLRQLSSGSQASAYHSSSMQSSQAAASAYSASTSSDFRQPYMDSQTTTDKSLAPGLDWIKSPQSSSAPHSMVLDINPLQYGSMEPDTNYSPIQPLTPKYSYMDQRSENPSLVEPLNWRYGGAGSDSTFGDYSSKYVPTAADVAAAHSALNGYDSKYIYGVPKDSNRYTYPSYNDFTDDYWRNTKKPALSAYLDYGKGAHSPYDNYDVVGVFGSKKKATAAAEQAAKYGQLVYSR